MGLAIGAVADGDAIRVDLRLVADVSAQAAAVDVHRDLPVLSRAGAARAC